MQIITKYESLDKCGYAESTYTLFDFNTVPDGELIEAIMAFLRAAEGEKVWESDEGVLTGYSIDDTMAWNSETKQWV